MTIQCPLCGQVIQAYYAPGGGRIAHCRCGAVWTIEHVLSSSTRTLLSKSPPMPRNAVPQAFYDAFKDSEVLP